MDDRPTPIAGRKPKTTRRPRDGQTTTTVPDEPPAQPPPPAAAPQPHAQDHTNGAAALDMPGSPRPTARHRELAAKMQAARTMREARALEQEFWRSVVMSAEGLAYGERLAVSTEDGYWKATDRAFGKAPVTIELETDAPQEVAVILDRLSPSALALLASLSLPPDAGQRLIERTLGAAPDAAPPRQDGPNQAKVEHTETGAERPRRKPLF